MVLYAVHAGPFTPEGTLDAASARLQGLKALGVSAVLLRSRPEAEDPLALKRFVDRSHALGMAAVLDFPELAGGCNLDGKGSDEVRGRLSAAALRCFAEFRADGLVIEAADELPDLSARPFLEEFSDAVQQFSRKENRLVYLLARSRRNNARLIRQRELGGMGLDALWSPDFGMALHGALGVPSGAGLDFEGIAPLAEALRSGYSFTGQHSGLHGRSHGSPPGSAPPRRFLVAWQDEGLSGVGQERPSSYLSRQAQKLAAGALLLSPFLPVLYMGEEYGEKAPYGSPLAWQLAEDDPLWKHYRRLLKLRREHPAFKDGSHDPSRVAGYKEQCVVTLLRSGPGGAVFAAFNFSDLPVDSKLAVPQGAWRLLLESAEQPAAAQTLGGGREVGLTLPAKSFALYERVSG
jgi:maltooligosyltrehalose trehalohydrolase